MFQINYKYFHCVSVIDYWYNALIDCSFLNSKCKRQNNIATLKIHEKAFLDLKIEVIDVSYYSIVYV